MTQLPFTREEFLDVFEAYNTALWPFALTLWLATALFLLLRANNQSAGLNILLALHWAWSGVVYHLLFFSVINPAAWLFGALFLIQAGLYFWHRKRISYNAGSRGRQIISVSLIAYAFAYPAIVWLGGHTYPRLPTFGIPCPTTILTIGLLFQSERPMPTGIAIVPVLWAFIGGSAAFLLGVWPDVVLLAAGTAYVVDSAFAE